MHLKRLIVKNFRNLRYVDIALTAGINIVVGDNGAGKTNITRALRLLLDPAVSSQGRDLSAEDFFAGSGGPGKASEILIAGEFAFNPDDERESNFANELLGGDDGIPRLVYRFRPNPGVAFQLDHGGLVDGNLRLEDYVSQRVVGTTRDLEALSWRDDLGGEPKESKLRQYHLIELPALRDVEQALKSQRSSPLYRLLQTIQIDPDSQRAILVALKEANDSIEERDSFRELADAISSSYAGLVGDIEPLTVSLGFSEPTLSQLLRTLGLFVSTEENAVAHGVDRNGLGFNNLLYAAMQIEYFRRRIQERRAGQLLIIEEPEAHLHPHAQEAFVQTLSEQQFQTIVTTHSAHVTASSGINAIVALTRTEGAATASNLAARANLSDAESSDLSRYLDATKASLLFARKVLLVEGASELMLLPMFARRMKINLAKRAISVIAMQGTHFDVFAKLFQTGALAMRAAILADGDQFRDDEGRAQAVFDDGAQVVRGGTDFVRTFSNRTTLEYAICQANSLMAIRDTSRELGAVRALQVFDRAIASETDADMAEAQLHTWRVASRYGKARFAQLLAGKKFDPPAYISDALRWLDRGDET